MDLRLDSVRRYGGLADLVGSILGRQRSNGIMTLSGARDKLRDGIMPEVLIIGAVVHGMSRPLPKVQ